MSLQFEYSVNILNYLYVFQSTFLLRVRRRAGNTVTVVAGSNLLNGNQSDSYKSEYIVWHEKYNGAKFVNDIGLIRVERDIKFNDKVQSIRLPTEAFNKDDYPVVLTGWGSTQLGGSTPNKLQEINLKVISQIRCIAQVAVPITESHICTLTKAGEGACHVSYILDMTLMIIGGTAGDFNFFICRVTPVVLSWLTAFKLVSSRLVVLVLAESLMSSPEFTLSSAG